jgi:hypothetical protein
MENIVCICCDLLEAIYRLLPVGQVATVTIVEEKKLDFFYHKLVQCYI